MVIKNKMKNKTNEIIQYTELLKRNKQINLLTQKGFIIIPKKNFKVVGYVLIGLGVLTIPIPLTTIPLITLGVFCLGLSKQDLINRTMKRFKLFLYKLKRRIK